MGANITELNTALAGTSKKNDHLSAYADSSLVPYAICAIRIRWFHRHLGDTLRWSTVKRIPAVEDSQVNMHECSPGPTVSPGVHTRHI